MLSSILSAAGGIASSLFGASEAKKNREKQDQYMLNGISYKVADAKRAGIHPLYALGANTMSFSPVSAGGPDVSFLGDMGQNIDRARSATSGPAVRGAARVLEGLTLERASLENDKLRSEIRRMNSAGTPPGLPDLAPADLSSMVPGWQTLRPELGQAAENAYSEAGGELFGGVGFTGDYFRNLKRLAPGAVPYLKKVWGPYFPARNYSRPNPVRR